MILPPSPFIPLANLKLESIPDQALVLDTIFYEAPALPILQGAYLRVEPGQICGLFGRNGTGKTTLLKVAAGQIRPASGLVIIDGERFAAPQRRRRFAKLAYLPQTPMLPPDMRVETLIRSFPNAYLMIHKPCKRLDGDLRAQLAAYGYMAAS